MRNVAHSKGPAAHRAAVLALVVALAGCSTVDNMLGTPSPGRDSTGAHPMAKDESGAQGGGETAKSGQAAKSDQAAKPQESSGGFFDRIFGTPSPPRDSTGAHPIPGANKPYPNVGTVPARPTASPEQERQKMVQGLVADRADARYTDETLRREEPHAEAEAAPAPKPQPSPAPQPAPSQPAPSQAAKSQPAPQPQAKATPARPAPAAPPAMEPEQVPATPPPPPPGYTQKPFVQSPAPPPVASMAPIPNPPLGRPAPPPENPAAGTASPNFGPPPADIDIARNQMASLGPTGVDGTESSFRVATVRFGEGSARLDGGDERALRRVAQLFKRQGGRITVVGHSSSFTRNMTAMRHQMVNFSLSLDRAQAVARALMRMGVPADSIQVAALSDSQPAYFESMPSGEAANRRAEVFLRR